MTKNQEYNQKLIKQINKKFIVGTNNTAFKKADQAIKLLIEANKYVE